MSVTPAVAVQVMAAAARGSAAPLNTPNSSNNSPANNSYLVGRNAHNARLHHHADETEVEDKYLRRDGDRQSVVGHSYYTCYMPHQMGAMALARRETGLCNYTEEYLPMNIGTKFHPPHSYSTRYTGTQIH